jgi:hypothetical protein
MNNLLNLLTFVAHSVWYTVRYAATGKSNDRKII